jgi:hypothetical protein
LGDVPILTIFYAALVVGASDRRTHEELAPMIRRPLAALASLLLTVLGAVFLLPDCASACSCAVPPGSQKERVEFAVSDSEAVFSGEVVDFEEGADSTPIFGPIETVSFRVSEVWKGPQRETLEVSTPTQGSACGYAFKEGQEYLVYAYTGKQGLQTDLCSQNKPLSEAGADLAVLGDGSEKPKDGGGEVLADTSGGVSAGAMVGVAGLALAASVLVVARLVRSG